MILVRFTIDNRNRLIFYGNTVGYVKDDAAVVDEMFQTDELSRYLARLNLTPQWKEGVFDRLAAGEAPGEELGQPQKGCRIWQLRKGVDVTMRFIGYEDLIKRFGEPDADNYTQVFDGDLGTNDLEQIYAICRDNPPPGYRATGWLCPMWWSCTMIPAASSSTVTVWASAPSSSTSVRSSANATK